MSMKIFQISFRHITILTRLQESLVQVKKFSKIKTQFEIFQKIFNPLLAYQQVIFIFSINMHFRQVIFYADRRIFNNKHFHSFEFRNHNSNYLLNTHYLLVNENSDYSMFEKIPWFWLAIFEYFLPHKKSFTQKKKLIKKILEIPTFF